MNKFVNEDEIQHPIQEENAPEQIDYLYEAQELIDDESGNPEIDRAIWTETALDILIETCNELRNYKFRTKKESYIFFEEEMIKNGFAFTWNQIENKLKTLKQTYLRRKSLNQELEPELETLFEDGSQIECEEPATKKFKHNDFPDESVCSNKAGWSEDATKVLLTLLREIKPKVGVSQAVKNKRQMWEYISNEMCNLNYNFTPSQVENKWKSLVRSYRKKNERNEVNKPQSLSNDDSLTDIDEPNHYIDESSYENSKTPQLESIDTRMIDNDSFNSEDVQKLAQSCMKIAKTFTLVQEETNKIAAQKLKLKQMQIQAYKERTKEIKQIGSHLSELVQHFKRKEDF